MKKLTLLLLSVLLVLSMAVPAMAAEPDFSVEYKGHTWIDNIRKALFGFDPVDTTYTATDLFDNFKGVMPGDVLTETVTFKNTAFSCDFIAVYLRIDVHSETENPLSENIAKTENLVSMQDFLSKLEMTVKNGEDVIFDGSPDKGTADPVYLGTLSRTEALTLDVTLHVPLDLGNEYQNRVGEVDWVFLIEERYDPIPPPETTEPETEPPVTEPEPPETETEPPETEPTPPETEPEPPETEPEPPETEPEPPVTEPEPPETEPEPPVTEPEPVETEPEPVETEPVPEDEPSLPQTGLLWWPVPVLIALGLMMFVVGLIMKRRQKTEE